MLPRISLAREDPSELRRFLAQMDKRLARHRR
jgi:hypothetical protein